MSAWFEVDLPQRGSKLVVASLPYPMSQRLRGIPKGMPLPTTPLDELIERAVEERRRAGGDLSHLIGTPYAKYATPAKELTRAVPVAPRSSHLGATSKAAAVGARAKVKAKERGRSILTNSSMRGTSSTDVAIVGRPVTGNAITTQATGSSSSVSAARTKTGRNLAKHRPQLPPVRGAQRGDKRKALQIAADPEQLQAALVTYDKEVLSAGDTSSFNVQTWHDVHWAVNWQSLGFDEAPEVLPLSPQKIRVVGAVLKEADYRSTKNYMSAVKKTHVGTGFKWDEQLELAAANFNRSTTRGLGPVRQSEPLPYERVAACDLNTDLVGHERFPADASAVFVLATLFLLREIEVAAARFTDMTFNDADLEVRLYLSVSKNDPTAKGTTRPWMCICVDEGSSTSHRRCPYHASKHHHAYLMEAFRDALRDDDEFPLFPDAMGRELDADMVLEFIEAVATLMNEPLYTDKGVRRFGKHSFRATGAVYLALVGTSVEKIQLVGRWSCGVVVHYTRSAPLKSIAEDFKRNEVERRAVKSAQDV